MLSPAELPSPATVSSAGTYRAPLLVYTNAWGLDFGRDWHMPVIDPAWRDVERGWLSWLRAVCFSPLDPVPRFPRAWICGALGRGRRLQRFSGMLLPRIDRLNRPSYLAAAVLHEPQLASPPIWVALEAKLDVWGEVARHQREHTPDPSEVLEGMRELAATPWLDVAEPLRIGEVGVHAERRLDEVGRGWREMLALMESSRTGPAEFATTDGDRLWYHGPDEEPLGPVDARQLWGLFHSRLAHAGRRGSPRAARAGFVSLSTHGSEMWRRRLAAVGRWIDIGELTASPRGAERAAESGAGDASPPPLEAPLEAPPQQAAQAGGSSPATAPSASSRRSPASASRRDPQIEAAQREEIARTLAARRRVHRRRRLGQGMTLAGLLLLGGALGLWLAGGGFEPTDTAGSAGNEEPFEPDADAPPAMRLAERLRHGAAQATDSTSEGGPASRDAGAEHRWRRALTRLVALAHTHDEPHLAHFLRTTASALVHEQPPPPPAEAKPVNELELERFLYARRVRDALELETDELDALAEALRRSLPDYVELLHE